MNLSPQQVAVVEWVKNGKGSAFVEAVAGAGKTTTLINALAETKGFVDFAAYNTKIAQEIKAKVGKLGLGNRVHVGTFHSFGFGAWRRSYPDVQAGTEAAKKKRDMTIDKFRSVKAPEALDNFVLKLVSLAKQRAIGLFGQIEDRKLWWDIIEHFDLAYELDDEGGNNDNLPNSMSLIERGVDLAMRTLQWHKAISPKIIDFDDMCFMPAVSGVKMFQADWVFVDEAQDTNPCRRALARKMLKPNGRACWVGDRCQPAGTKITMANGAIKLIEELKQGDLVRTFIRRDSSFRQAGRAVTGITKRMFKGLSVTIDSGGKSSTYTSNHYCYVQLKSICNKYCVYLMRKGNLWRVGTSLMQNGQGVCGPMSRKRLERADDVWILHLFNTEREAKTYEFKVATEYGVPELLFRAPGSELSFYWENTQKSIDLAWASLNKCKLEAAAHDLLEDHGRDKAYPLNEMASKPGQFWVTRPIKMRACNLMTGMSVLHYDGTAHYDRSNFTPIVVRSGHWEGEVFSLDVDIDHSYIADGIATFNCQAIYGFQGSDDDAIDQIVRDFGCQTMPLTITYRCPKKVVEMAHEVVSHIQAADTAPEGIVEHAEMEQLFGMPKYDPDVKDASTLPPGYKLLPDDAILCRNTKPLVKLAFALIRQGIACHVEGKDIGIGLLKLVDRFKAKTITAFRDKLTAWAEKEIEKLMAKGREIQAENLRDRVDTLFVMMDAHPPAADKEALRARIAMMFTDGENEAKPTVTLSTVHRSKGREWQRVFILGKDKYMPSPFARQEWQLQQERNLIYVCVTRAQSELILVNVPEGF